MTKSVSAAHDDVAVESNKAVPTANPPANQPADAPAQQAPAKSGSAGYDVSRPHGKCGVCGETIAPDAKFMAALRETPLGFERLDCCLKCWEKFDAQNPAAGASPGEIVAHWRATMPRHEVKKKMFVDDEVLCGLFERLADAAEPAKINFRFVLGLILMRKRLLIYESTRREKPAGGAADPGKPVGGDRWCVRFRGREDLLEMLDPQLTEDQMRDVSQQLAQILNEEV